jgi:hypothetical protein
MNIKLIEFEMNTCVKENEIFVVLYDETFVSEDYVRSLIFKALIDLYEYQLPSYRSCVFMTKETYNNVFKSLKGKV